MLTLVTGDSEVRNFVTVKTFFFWLAIAVSLNFFVVWFDMKNIAIMRFSIVFEIFDAFSQIKNFKIYDASLKLKIDKINENIVLILRLTP